MCSTFFIPKSVADLGCGRDTWLKAFGKYGPENLVGFDGDWNSQSQIVDPSIKYIPIDLNKPIDNLKDRFDLAISLEVAEHLKKESSTTFVRNITALSDVIMFEAAYKNQGVESY
ncbi:MAG: methyltransferase domain-containing protein [Acetobacter sp.]|nr:methyltransferase domain-containing protein [Acetobacter sp.]